MGALSVTAWALLLWSTSLYGCPEPFASPIALCQLCPWICLQPPTTALNFSFQVPTCIVRRCVLQQIIIHSQVEFATEEIVAFLATATFVPTLFLGEQNNTPSSIDSPSPIDTQSIYSLRLIS